MTTRSPQQQTSLSMDQEEQDLLDALDKDQLQSVATPELLLQLQQAARATGNKDQRINIRLSSADLQALRVRALQLGMPYQTLISSVLHRYVSGEFSDEERPQRAA